jgi:radical SAM superfamily enzyme
MELLRDDIVVHRLTGDPHPGELLAPLWSLDKSQNIRLIHDEFERRDTWQGKNLRPSSAGKQHLRT